MSKKCIWCGRAVNPGLAGNGYYCPCCDEDMTEADVNDMTVFEIITASPEVLAESLVFWEGGWTSRFIKFTTTNREEAIAATVAKLKEVCDDTK
jgi:hypothetical protein